MSTRVFGGEYYNQAPWSNRVMLIGHPGPALWISPRNQSRTAIDTYNPDRIKEINEPLGHHVGDRRAAGHWDSRVARPDFYDFAR